MSEAKSVERTVRVITNQKIKEGVEPVEGFPLRDWSIEVYLLDADGNEVPATIFDKCTYHLHPTFTNPVRSLKKAPFKIAEEGWGGFEMGVVLTYLDRAGDEKLSHDLNFNEEKYVVDHKVRVPLKTEKLRKLLAESGPVPSDSGTPGGEAIGDKRKSGAVSSAGVDKKRSKQNVSSAIKGSVKGSVDLEKLAKGLTKLSEDDLLGVVQMVTDNRTADMNIKNDVEEGEFTMDLFTLPDSLLKSLSEYVKKRTE